MLISLADALSGLGTGLALIAAIGTQNALLLRSGIKRDHVTWLVLVCALSDIILIAAGIGGMGALVEAAPALIQWVTWIGALFLFAYGLMSLRKGLLGTAETLEASDAPDPDAGPDQAAVSSTYGHSGVAHASSSSSGGRGLSHRSKLIVTMLALTWLNPHVYLDTLVFLGSAATAHGDGRWSFGIGAMSASVLWFGVLGYGARYLAPLFARPLTWKVLDTGVGLLMLFLGYKLLAGA